MAKRRGLFVRGAVGILTSCAFAACHHASASSSRVMDRQGVYQFSEHVTGRGASAEEVDIIGDVVVLADSVAVGDVRPGPCRLDTGGTSPGPIVYVCGNVVLSFDRQDPVYHSMYTATLAGNQSRQVCVRYVTDVGARQVCAEYRTETTQQIGKIGGPLRLTRAPN